jgi:hypothetical protein
MFPSASASECRPKTIWDSWVMGHG